MNRQNQLDGLEFNQYLILNESVYRNMDRLGVRHPQPRIRSLHEAMAGGPYRLMAELRGDVKFLGIDFSGMFTSQDYMIINPGIRIYRREPAGPG